MLRVLSFLGLLPIVVGLPAAVPTAGPVVNTALGAVQGTAYPKYREFLGMPYAAPPVHKLRFLPPQQKAPWNRTLDATKVSPGCPRDATWYTLNPKMSEDCLYINLWAPPLEPADNARLPVMVWIYGGAYMSGSGDDLQTRGAEMVATHGDVIVVTFNYRLGVLGWLGSETLRRHTFAETGVNSTGNMGLQDMIQALQWVRQNAAAFGGDPNNVMLFGESAGAGAVAALLTTPGSKGLFHKAAMQSGGFQRWTTMGLEHAEGNFAALLKFLTKHHTKKRPHPLCTAGSDALACLYSHKVHGQKLVYIAEAGIYQYETDGSLWDGYNQDQWGPIVDGVVLSEHPFRALQRGAWHGVPVIIGTNKDEGTEFMDACPNGEGYSGQPTCNITTKAYNRIYNMEYNSTKVNDKKYFPDQQYRNWISINFGAENVAPLFAIYNSTGPGLFKTNYWAGEFMIGDYIMSCTSLEASRIMSTTQPRTYQYYFTHTPGSGTFIDAGYYGGYSGYSYVDDGYGACHGCEIPFVFNQAGNKTWGLNGTGDDALGSQMSTYWSNFAWNSDPNNSSGRAHMASLPMWDPVMPDSDGAMNFNATEVKSETAMAHPHPRAHLCEAFWNGYFHHTGWFK